MTKQEQQRAKSALESIFLRIQSTPSDRASTTTETYSSGKEEIPEPAVQVSEFDRYLNSLQSTSAAEASAESDVPAFAEALINVERLGRLQMPNVWSIISKYPLIVQPVSRIVSCLPCTQVSVERMFSHLKLVLRENRVRMGNDLTDAIVFMRTNKSV